MLQFHGKSKMPSGSRLLRRRRSPQRLESLDWTAILFAGCFMNSGKLSMVARHCRTRANDGATLLSPWSACRVTAILPHLIREGWPTTRPERLIHPGSIKAIRIDVDLLVCGSSWIICLSAPVRGLPRRKKLFSSVCMRDLQISILGRVRPVGVLPLPTP
jgi:hypothetical protein